MTASIKVTYFMNTYHHTSIKGAGDSSVSKMTGCRTDMWGLVPGRGTDFLFTTMVTLDLKTTQPTTEQVLIKWLRHETDQ
jgi:hypothetical protein